VSRWAFVFMVRRSKPYRIRLSVTRSPHVVSASYYARFMAMGWIVGVGARLAEPRPGVAAWLEDGDLRLQDREAGVTVSIPCSHRAIERAWKFKVKALKVIGKDLNERQERLMWEREVERMVEAADWRATRDSLGANELVYVPAETKREILAALKPEMA
jgi:hypothetical protein